MQAVMQATAAHAQPSRRGPMAEAGWATATGRTKMSNVAVDAAAACGDTIPAKSTANPTTAMTPTETHLCVETTVPSAMRPLPTSQSRTKENRRVRGRPGKSTSRSSAKDPKAPRRLT